MPMEILQKRKHTTWAIWWISTLLLAASLNSQAQQHYLLHLKDKGKHHFTSEELFTPVGYLRKQVFAISATTTDYPISKDYLSAIQADGFRVVAFSKWLNIVAVKGENFPDFPFVIHVQPFDIQQTTESRLVHVPEPKMKVLKSQLGDSLVNLQIHQPNILKDLKGKGLGMKIAVLDGGFLHMKDSAAYQYQQSRVVYQQDIVNQSSVYHYSNHGTLVTSFITGVEYNRGEGSAVVLTAGAPRAELGLFVTEDVATESVLEELNWVRAAEIADSLGYDIVSTSLGYTEFDNPDENYTYEDLDGNTTIISKGASLAFEKGLLVSTSAGNQGDKDWFYISAPADAKGSLVSGAIDPQGNAAFFSSRGPTADGRVKPDVMTVGWNATTINESGVAFTGNGTSFSCPITTGLAAALWSEFPNVPAAAIRESLIQSTDRLDKPTSEYGNGIPDLTLAYNWLKEYWLNYKNPKGNGQVLIYPNPTVEEVSFANIAPAEIQSIRVQNSSGAKVFEKENPKQISFTHSELNMQEAGMYYITVTTSSAEHVLRVVVQ